MWTRRPNASELSDSRVGPLVVSDVQLISQLITTISIDGCRTTTFGGPPSWTRVNLRNGVVMIGRLSAAVAAAVVLALPGATSAQQSPSQESAVPIPPGQIEAAV